MTDDTGPTDEEVLFALDFEIPIAPSHDAPRCRMCARPARWIKPRQEYAPYCSGQFCTNRERLCQLASCGRPFTINIDGAGNKYCSTECKVLGYHPRQPKSCRCCGQEMGRENKYLCASCHARLKHVQARLRDHHVDHEHMRRLLTDPGCEICGAELLTPVLGRNGQRRARLVVDHDHACCTGGTSCGECVRGFLCGRCNIALGHIADNPDTAQAMATYLRTHTP